MSLNLAHLQLHECCIVAQMNRTCPLCRADVTELTKIDVDWYFNDADTTSNRQLQQPALVHFSHVLASTFLTVLCACRLCLIQVWYAVRRTYLRFTCVVSAGEYIVRLFLLPYCGVHMVNVFTFFASSFVLDHSTANCYVVRCTLHYTFSSSYRHRSWVRTGYKFSSRETLPFLQVSCQKV